MYLHTCLGHHSQLRVHICTKYLYIPQYSSIYIMGCNVSPSPTDVSPTENSWMLHPLEKVSLGYFAPDQTIPSLSFDLLERSDTRLPTATRLSAAKRWSSMCGLRVHTTEGSQSKNLVRGVGEASQTPHWSIRCRRPTEVAIAADGASSMLDGWRGPGSGHIGQGHNIQGTLCSRGATSKNFRSGTHRSGTHQPCIHNGPSSNCLII
jgi:hypothetical protein